MARKSRKQRDVASNLGIKNLYHVGAYIRLSVTDRKQKGDSIETQQAIIESFIAEHPDMELREIYIDNGKSGQTFERPSFQRMIEDIESDKINCCVVKDLSRLGRNAIDTGYYVEKYFPSKNIRFAAVTDNYDSNNGDSGGIMLSLKNMINEAYALDVSRKVRATFQMNIKNGYFVGGQAPYGYLKHPDDCHKLIVDEYAAGIVRQIFDMAADGQRINAILEWLNGDEILPPNRYLCSIGKRSPKARGADNIYWSYRGVRSILDNRIYCGDMVQGRKTTINGACKRLPETEWTITENTHEAVVSREIFAVVQELLKQPDKSPRFSTAKTDNIFQGKLFCGCCERPMPRKRDGEKFYRFKCSTPKQYSSYACTGMKIGEKLLKEKIFNLLKNHEVVLSRVATTEPVNDYNAELTAVKTELCKNRMFLKGLYESLIVGDITDFEYKEMKSGYETKIAELTAREKQLRDNAHARIQQEKALSKVQESVQRIESVSDLTAEVIDKVVEKIVVHENNRITVKFRFMEEVVEHE